MPDSPRPSAARFILRALQYRNYRLFFSGQLVSLIGTWLTIVATNWLVYRLASDRAPGRVALLLGTVGFAGQIPLLLLSPFAGVIVDRVSKHRILLVTQFLSMAQSFALAWLALRHVITIPQIILLNAFQGIVNALDVPARQALVVDMVERREDLGNAIALSSSMVHAARLIGPAIAGVLIYRFGEGWCFLLDGFSYLAVLGALLMMRVRPEPSKQPPRHPLRALSEGLVYAYRFLPIRIILVLVAVTSMMSVAQSTLMPIYADKVLGGRERVYGLLLCSSGLGALAGSIYLASRRSVLGLGRVIFSTNAALGLGIIAFSLSGSLWLSMLLLLATGGAMVTQMASCNTLLQTLVDDDKRGRVMSLYAMSFMGIAPVGQLLAGALAQATSPRTTLMVAGGVCVFSAWMFALGLTHLRPMIRPIYIKKGIIHEVAAGMETAAEMTTAARE